MTTAQSTRAIHAVAACVLALTVVATIGVPRCAAHDRLALRAGRTAIVPRRVTSNRALAAGVRDPRSVAARPTGLTRRAGTASATVLAASVALVTREAAAVEPFELLRKGTTGVMRYAVDWTHDLIASNGFGCWSVGLFVASAVAVATTAGVRVLLRRRGIDDHPDVIPVLQMYASWQTPLLYIGIASLLGTGAHLVLRGG